eukprot:PhM_4_TR7617/c0_g1_i1/m.33448
MTLEKPNLYQRQRKLVVAPKISSGPNATSLLKIIHFQHGRSTLDDPAEPIPTEFSPNSRNFYSTTVIGPGYEGPPRLVPDVFRKGEMRDLSFHAGTKESPRVRLERNRQEAIKQMESVKASPRAPHHTTTTSDAQPSHQHATAVKSTGPQTTSALGNGFDKIAQHLRTMQPNTEPSAMPAEQLFFLPPLAGVTATGRTKSVGVAVMGVNAMTARPQRTSSTLDSPNMGGFKEMAAARQSVMFSNDITTVMPPTPPRAPTESHRTTTTSERGSRSASTMTGTTTVSLPARFRLRMTQEKDTLVGDRSAHEPMSALPPKGYTPTPHTPRSSAVFPSPRFEDLPPSARRPNVTPRRKKSVVEEPEPEPEQELVPHPPLSPSAESTVLGQGTATDGLPEEVQASAYLDSTTYADTASASKQASAMFTAQSTTVDVAHNDSFATGGLPTGKSAVLTPAESVLSNREVTSVADSD